MPINTATGAFTYTSPTVATGEVAGNTIPSAGWNQIHTDLQNASTQIYQQYLAGQTIGKNLVWGNGGFEVWQRGAGSSTAINVNSTGGTYTADRWYLVTAASVTCSVAAVAGIDTPNNSTLACQITRNSGTTAAASSFGYPLDTESCFALRGQKVAVSFWAKTGAGWSPTNGTIQLTVVAGTGSPVKNIVGYTNQTIVWQGTVNITAGAAAALYTSSSFTINTNVAAATNINQAEVQFFWTYQGAASATDQITFDNVQIEVQGSLAAPYTNAGYVGGAYDHLPFDVMLYDCRQHYQKTFPYSIAPAQNVGTATGGAGIAAVASGAAGIAKVAQMWLFNPPMRASPSTITTYHPSAATANWFNTGNSGGTVATVAATVTISSSMGALIYSASVSASVGDMLVIHATADAGI